jgi:N-acetylglucosaminyl-diphospho-decaprenol L-rhamnosyltransferase
MSPVSDPNPRPPAGPTAPVTVVVIHRNRPDAVGRTVAAFRDQTVATGVMVIDNGSVAETVAALPELVGEATLVVTGSNLGFGPGGNVGLRRFLHHETGEWVALAPHDALPDPDTLEKMLAAVEDRPGVGLMSADVGDGMRPVIDPYLGTIDARPNVDEGYDAADYPHGTLMMCRRACLEEIGIFDERYFAYCEESELAIRAAKAGWGCGVIRGAMVRNPGMSASIERVAYLQLRNTLLMLREHYGRRNEWFRLVVALIQLPVGMVHPPSRGLHWSPRGRLKGIRDHLLGRYGAPPVDVGGG